MAGDIVTKRNLFDLVQYSKVESSPFWGGAEFVIGNTPQQGINWIGQLPAVKAVIIKTRPGSYEEDGWSDESKANYHYSFKARNSVISFQEKANRVLINQPQFLYPIFLFAECKEGWMFEGKFSVVELEERYVVLSRGTNFVNQDVLGIVDAQYQEGGRRYVAHLMIERSKEAVIAVKSLNNWICEICGIDFEKQYGVPYIEAHHKIPVSTYSENYLVQIEDFALLCPNCHKAVHIHMKESGKSYDEIRIALSGGS
tara:strand:+ start:3516 stop:4283 length:768 start_codon:yes stop_codon:yes gene_type:complete